jgi:hypothetical protein
MKAEKSTIQKYDRSIISTILYTDAKAEQKFHAL